jgi:hypothetical protein
MNPLASFTDPSNPGANQAITPDWSENNYTTNSPVLHDKV